MKEKIRKYVNQEKWLLIFVVVIAIFSYGYKVFNFALTGDEERELILGTSYTSWFELPLGRWGQWIFRLVFMDGMRFTPGYGDLLAVVFLAISAIVWCSNFELLYREKISTCAKCIFSGIYMTVPYATASVMCYTFLNASSMLAILSVSLAMKFIIISFIEKKNRNLFLAVMLETYALATYQAHASDIILASVICIFIYTYTDADLKIKDLIQKILRYAVVFFSSFVLYEIVSKVVKLREYSKDLSTYTDAFIMWGTDSPGQLIKKLISSIAETYNQKETVGAIYLLLTVALFYVIIILNTIINKKIKQKIFYFLISLLIFPATYSVSIALGGMTHYATHTAVLLMAGFMWFHIVTIVKKKYIYKMLICVSFLIMLRQIDLDNRIYWGEHLMSELDMQLGYEIGTEIYRVADTRDVEKPVVIVGKYRHNAPNVIEVGMAGRSIFLRNNGYKLYYLKYLGFNFKQPTNEQVASAEIVAENMPLWPLEGSVKETDDLIIVHLSNFK